MYIIIFNSFFMGDILYLVGLHYIGITQRKLHKLFIDTQDYKYVFENLSENKLSKLGYNSKQIQSILERYSKINFNYLEKKIKERNVKIITIYDKNYPELLKEIPNPPFLFYLRGKIDNSPKLSVVGTRKISSYGSNIIKRFIPDLSNYFTIVSGGAAGCDTEAHEYTIGSKNKTISIIGTGIDQDYPVSNEKLYDRIVKSGGGVLSIFPIGEVGNPYNFPVRNEIVAGLSVGTLIIEGKEKSGTLITASLALEMGKDLFAVPGDVFKPNSFGCNNLIKNGNAKLVSVVSDVLEEYNINTTKREIKKIVFNDDLEEKIYNFILLESTTTNELVKKTGFDISLITGKLSMLELRKIVKKGFGGKYEIN